MRNNKRIRALLIIIFYLRRNSSTSSNESNENKMMKLSFLRRIQKTFYGVFIRARSRADEKIHWRDLYAISQRSRHLSGRGVDSSTACNEKESAVTSVLLRDRTDRNFPSWNQCKFIKMFQRKIKIEDLYYKINFKPKEMIPVSMVLDDENWTLETEKDYDFFHV